MQDRRGTWGSRFGFLAAAIGSSVGLGNLWAFPYRMGENGGFAFLAVYLPLAAAVGVPLIAAELALGRRARRGPVGAFRAVFRGPLRQAGWLSALCAYLFTAFYCVLGGWCLQYLVWNLAAAFGFGPTGDGAALFALASGSPARCAGYALAYLALSVLVVRAGVARGAERLSRIAMPLLTVLLALLAARCLALPGAAAGVRYMFRPDFRPLQTDFLGVLAAAGGQAFFSLSLGLGSLIAYGSYLPETEDLAKSAAVVAAADTAFALLAGLVVIPAAFALGGAEAALAGPELLFVTLQDVFARMGSAGPWLGALFYLLAALAALTSSVALVQLLADLAREDMGTPGRPDRGAAAGLAGLALAPAALWVALHPLEAGGGGLLPLFTRLTEGGLMPLAALALAFGLGYARPALAGELGPGRLRRRAFVFCCRVLAPAGAALVLLGNLT